MNSRARRIEPGRFAAGLLVFVMLAFGFLSSSGCAWIGSALDALDGSNATEDAGDTPLPSSLPAGETAGAQQDVYRENPVHALICAFREDLSLAADGITEAAASSEDAALALYCMKLFACEADIALVDATVGLMSSEGQGWTVSLVDNYAGSGSMSSRGVFEYDMDDGTVIAGRADEGSLYAYVGSNIAAPNEESYPAETQSAEAVSGTGEDFTSEPTAEPTPYAAPEPSAGEALAIVLRKTEGGWLLTVKGDGECRAVFVSDGSASSRRISFAVLPADCAAETLTELNAEKLGTPVLYFSGGSAEMDKPKNSV